MVAIWGPCCGRGGWAGDAGSAMRLKITFALFLALWLYGFATTIIGFLR